MTRKLRFFYIGRRRRLIAVLAMGFATWGSAASGAITANNSGTLLNNAYETPVAESIETPLPVGALTLQSASLFSAPVTTTAAPIPSEQFIIFYESVPASSYTSQPFGGSHTTAMMASDSESSWTTNEVTPAPEPSTWSAAALAALAVLWLRRRMIVSHLDKPTGRLVALKPF